MTRPLSLAAMLVITALNAFAQANRAPDALNDQYSTNEDTTLSVDASRGVLANDTDPDNDALTATLVTPPPKGTLDFKSNGSFTYIPAANFFGTIGFVYRATDGRGGGDGAVVTITVNPVNDPPIARNDEYSGTSGTHLAVLAPGVLSNDGDPEGSRLTAILKTQPANGTVVLGDGGGFGYQPRSGFVGTDSFTYDASDGALTSTATVTITVSAKPPEIVGFRASRTVIAAGQSTALFWGVSGATSVTIQPLIGTVPIRGTREVSPPTTTTFTITATSPFGSATQQLTIEVITTPEIAVIARPRGMIDIPGGRNAVDRYTLANLGGGAAEIRVSNSGDFFTQSPASFRLEPGTTQTVFIQSLPMPVGTYRGESVVTVVGSTIELRLQVRLLSIAVPQGRSESAAASYRVDRSDDSSASVTFRNTGTDTLEGIIVTGAPWLESSVDRVSIPPGQSVTAQLQIDRTKRPDRNRLNGAQSASVSLRHFRGSGAAKIAPLNGTPSIGSSTVVVKDNSKPPVTSSAIPPLAANEIAYYIPALAHRGSVVGDLSLYNTASTSASTNLQMFALTGGASSASAQLATVSFTSSSSSVAYSDLMKGVFGQQSASGSITLRGTAANSVSIGATTVAVGAGFHGGVLTPFRSDRSAAKGESIYLTGVRKDSTGSTDLHLQETIGAAATVNVDFLSATGAVMSSRTESLGAFQYIERVDVVPSGTATIRVSNASSSSGSVVARAIVVDSTTGDMTDVVDWKRTTSAPVGETQIIPHVERSASSATDLTLTNRGTTATTVMLGYVTATAARRRGARPLTNSSGGGTTEESVTLEPGETKTLRDVLATQFGRTGDSSGYITVNTSSADVSATSVLVASSSTTTLPILPRSSAVHSGEGRQFIDLEDADSESVTNKVAGTFRTSFGVVETSGSSVTVRATLHYAYTGSLSPVVMRGVATKEIVVAANQSVTIHDMARTLIGSSRDNLGDLHDLQLDLDVISGDGAVIPYVISTDNATGDSLFRW